jgi:gluconolactonase
MPRVALDLNKEEDRQKVKGVWRHALGLVPGEQNQGLVGELEASPARLVDYDDSKWQVWDNVREPVSKGFTFGWWRITIELPESLDGMSLAGSNVLFETNVDNYGEVWIDGQMTDFANAAVVGFNAQQRVVVSPSAVPGTKHLIACLAANGPFAQARGAIFLRYATLAFETRG